MSTTMTVEEVRDQWDALIRRLAPGDEIVITDNNRPVARLVGDAPPSTQPPRAAPEQHKVSVKLAKGKNTVLLKVANGNNPHGFYFSLTSAEELKPVAKK